MQRLARTALAATFLTAVSTQAFAADLVIWWNKSYYPEEDQQFDKIVTDFEKKTGKDVEYVYYTNEDVPRKVLAALTAGQPPDLVLRLSVRSRAHLALGVRRRARGRLGRGRRDQGLPAAHGDPGGDPAERADRPSARSTPFRWRSRSSTSTSGRAWSRRPDSASTTSPRPGTNGGTGGARPRSRRCARRPATGRSIGVGQPMSSSASDTIFAYMMFLNAFDTKLVDEQGNLTGRRPEDARGHDRGARELHQAVPRRLRPARRRELAGQRQQRQLQESDHHHGAQSVAVDPGLGVRQQRSLHEPDGHHGVAG